MPNNYYAVIMAGGGGTRLWPLSRQATPKQLLPLIADSTLFQTALKRLQRVFSPEHILVVTNQQQAARLQEQAPELKPENFLLEPQPRGTAAAIGLAAAYLQARDPGAVMAVLTADHYIGNEAEFERYLLAARQLAEQGHLVTLGIEPSYAATQFGYIQLGAALAEVDGYTAYKAQRFKEKPAAAEAEAMLVEGGYAWNSGMFIWQVARIWQEFQRHMPELHEALEKISAAWNQTDFATVLAYEWPRIAAQTIDYGVMEQAADVAVIPARDMAWNDVGSWSSLFEVLEVDASGNLVLSERHLDIDSRNVLIHSNGQERMVVTVGVENMVVVDTGDVLLICSKERAQDLRKVIELLKEKGLQQYL